MGSFKEQTFAERRTAATEAKKQQLAAFKARPGPEDPKTIQRRNERLALEEARAIRNAEREARRQEELARLAVEEAERQAALAAQHAREEEERLAAEVAKKAERLRDAARVVADEAARKAKRDARYAARKARNN